MTEPKVIPMPGVPITPGMLIAELMDARDEIESIAVVVRVKGLGLRTYRSAMSTAELALGAAVLMSDAVDRERPA